MSAFLPTCAGVDVFILCLLLLRIRQLHKLRERQEEVRRRRRERLAAYHKRAEDRHKNAEARSRALLISHLNPTQRQQFELQKSFDVLGSDGRRYQLRPEKAYGVRSAKLSYCAYPPGVPIYDAMLAQKLLIETNAKAFRRVAFSKPIREIFS